MKHDTEVFISKDLMKLPEFRPEEIEIDRPFKMYKETGSGKYGPIFFNEVERQTLNQGPGVVFHPSVDFEFTPEKFQRAIEVITSFPIPGATQLEYEQGYKYVGKIVEPIIDVRNMVGNVWGGWQNLIGDNPLSDQRYDFKESYEYADFLLNIGPYQLKQQIQDMSFGKFTNLSGQSDYYVISNGRHRMLIFLALSEMGCEVNLTNVETMAYKQDNK